MPRATFWFATISTAPAHGAPTVPDDVDVDVDEDELDVVDEALVLLLLLVEPLPVELDDEVAEGPAPVVEELDEAGAPPPALLVLAGLLPPASPPLADEPPAPAPSRTGSGPVAQAAIPAAPRAKRAPTHHVPTRLKRIVSPFFSTDARRKGGFPMVPTLAQWPAAPSSPKGPSSRILAHFVG